MSSGWGVGVCDCPWALGHGSALLSLFYNVKMDSDEGQEMT